jgi:hypothetical protein
MTNYPRIHQVEKFEAPLPPEEPAQAAGMGSLPPVQARGGMAYLFGDAAMQSTGTTGGGPLSAPRPPWRAASDRQSGGPCRPASRGSWQCSSPGQGSA